MTNIIYKIQIVIIKVIIFTINNHQIIKVSIKILIPNTNKVNLKKNKKKLKN